MKARVKATGEIVVLYGTIDSCVWVTTDLRQYWESELEFIDNDERRSDMGKTIEEAAKEYADNAYYPAPDYGWYESDDEQMKECMSDTFKAGANYVYELPLSSRLTAEEKERARRIYMEYKWLYAKHKDSVFRWAEVYKGKYELLESIFGADFFKEGE